MSDLSGIKPKVGETRYGHEIGKVRWHKYEWCRCSLCGKERWVQTKWGLPVCKICLGCHNASRMEKSRHWLGGRLMGYFGYIFVKLPSDDFFFPMATKSGYVREHRLVMAQHLGRNLRLGEIVHHKNHVRDDNKLSNLQLVSEGRHKQITMLERRITHLEKENGKLKRLLAGGGDGEQE